ncbi:MAG: hypothetical protein QG670_2543 [Thermoproteota archaeon]|nr:hypothetical protein [Thermoproteota archaeon]
MNKTIKTLIVAGMLLPILLSLTSQITSVHAASPTAYLGLSGYPTSTTEVQNIINMMDTNGLNIYRMSFNPIWSSSRHPYKSSYIQYFLDHCDYMIIVDRNHLYPPTEASASTARNNWATVKDSVFEVLEAWPNNPRVAVELINEYISKDFYTRMQQLVTDIRAAGYTNPIVVNKWNQAWTVINDPLGKTYQGYHFYFNTWSVSSAISQMKTALSKGIKLISTEVGAHYNEYNSFTTSTVDELSSFLSQCASLGVGNTVWMNENLNNWPCYQSLDLDFPAVGSPIEGDGDGEGREDDPSMSILFEDGFESGSFSAWSGTSVTSGETKSITTTIVQSNTRSAMFTSNNGGGYEKAYAYKTVSASSEFHAKGYFYVSKSGIIDVDDRFFFLIFSSGSNNLAYAGIRQTTSGTRWCLTTRQGTGYVDILSSSAPASIIGQWYYVELHWKKDSVNGLAEMYVDGTRVCVSTATNTAAYGDATQLKAGIAETYGCGSTTVYADNISLGCPS